MHTKRMITVVALLAVLAGLLGVRQEALGQVCGFTCPLDPKCANQNNPCGWKPMGQCGCFVQNLYTTWKCTNTGPKVYCMYGSPYKCAEMRLCVDAYVLGYYVGCQNSGLGCTANRWYDEIYGNAVTCY